MCAPDMWPFLFLQIVKNKCKKSSNGSKKISYLSKKLSNQSKNQLIQLILVEQTFFSHFIHLKTQSVYCNHYCLRIKLDRSIRSSVPFGHFELGWTWQWPWLWSCSQFWHTAVLTAPPVINQLPKQWRRLSTTAANRKLWAGDFDQRKYKDPLTIKKV